MKNTFVKFASLTALSAILFTACKKDKVETPAPVEQELITTIKLNVTGDGGFSKTFTYKVENGFGSTTQGNIIKDDIVLAPNKTYNVSVELLNEKVSPVENITEEVVGESDEHLFLFQSNPATGNGAISFSDGSKDANGSPFNQAIKFNTATAGDGALTLTLKHQPTNKAATTPDAAGGETDVEATFAVKLQ